MKQNNPITDSKATMKEKRKWQIAFRRYVMDGSPSEAYAPYFGIDKINLRKWFELQFSEGLSWESFGTDWQFDHIVPVAYFDFNKEDDLYLCWNFTNIRVENKVWRQEGMEAVGRNGFGPVDVLGAKQYFIALYKNTGFSVCEKMVSKLEAIEASMAAPNPALENFVLNQKDRLENIAGLTKEEFLRFNAGMQIEDLLLEREILKKFG